MPELGALGLRHRLAHDLAQRVAERAFHGECDRRDGHHDDDGLSRAPEKEGKAGGHPPHRFTQGSDRRCPTQPFALE